MAILNNTLLPLGAGAITFKELLPKIVGFKLF
jgi:hypothetical protein